MLGRLAAMDRRWDKLAYLLSTLGKVSTTVQYLFTPPRARPRDLGHLGKPTEELGKQKFSRCVEKASSRICLQLEVSRGIGACTLLSNLGSL